MSKIEALFIDPQVDFCDPTGNLYVKGADKDMERLATMIKRTKSKIDDIHVTMDSHHYVDVAHPVFWKNSSGQHPNPFTIISSSDVRNGVWNPTNLSWRKRMLDYVEALEKGGKYPLCIWPPHTLIGSEGHNVFPVLFEALLEWEKDFAMVDYVTKGSNVFTEHYSAIRAEVVDQLDMTTQINTRLINTLMEADLVVIAGEAGSHCLKNTVEDIATAFGDNAYIKKLVLLTDATSPVPGFEKQQEDFIKNMVAKGMQLSTTTTFLA